MAAHISRRWTDWPIGSQLNSFILLANGSMLSICPMSALTGIFLVHASNWLCVSKVCNFGFQAWMKEVWCYAYKLMLTKKIFHISYQEIWNSDIVARRARIHKAESYNILILILWYVTSLTYANANWMLGLKASRSLKRRHKYRLLV